MSENPSLKQETVAPRTPAEWVSLGVALLLLAGVVGTVIVLWVDSSDNQIEFEIEHQSIYQQASKFYLQISVTNNGDRAAQAVTVEGKLTIEGEEEISTTTFDFIPARSKVQGVLIFSHQPEAVEVRVTSFQQP